MGLRFVSCQGLGGAFDLAATQAGMTMAHKVQQDAGFGSSNTLANRHLLGHEWSIEHGDGGTWTPIEADVVVGSPPCSGFSVLTQAEGFRGDDSPINHCMWDFIRYTAKICPQIAIFESVQGAYRQGHELMTALHRELEELTGEKWQLTHVLHNNLSLGGCAMRRRYFWVASRVPFGVDVPDLPFIPTANDALHDLEPLGITWTSQPYRHPPTRWSRRLRSTTGRVDGHMTTSTPQWYRARWVADNLGGWPRGSALEDLCREHDEQFGDLPGDPNGQTSREVGWHYPVTSRLMNGGSPTRTTRVKHLRARNFSMGPTQLYRWRGDRHAYVITGGALTEYVHPCLLRTFTHREAARIMGFPDDWSIAPQRWDGRLGAYWGKGVPVDSGRWIAHWAKESIEGNPGSLTGDPSSRDENVVDVTHHWKNFLGENVADYYARTR